MKRIPGWLLISLLGAMVGAQMRLRRKLRRLARWIESEGHLLHTAIRVTHQIRGSIDIDQIAQVAIDEVARALDVEHCVLTIQSKDACSTLVKCSCGDNDHERDVVIAETILAVNRTLSHERFDRYVINGYRPQGNSQIKQETVPVLGVPIIHEEDRLAGTLLVVSCVPTRVWLESEVQLLFAVAYQVLLAVIHARLFKLKQDEATTDQLTGCLNRRAFDAKLEVCLQTARENGESLSLILLDVDRFKDINDTYGHPSGDKVLQRVGQILRNQGGYGAIAARLGGDEFGLILPRHSIENAASVSERIREELADSRVTKVQQLLTVSSGVAALPANAASSNQLYEMTDKALYAAKESGRNCTRTA